MKESSSEASEREAGPQQQGVVPRNSCNRPLVIGDNCQLVRKDKIVVGRRMSCGGWLQARRGYLYVDTATNKPKLAGR